MHRWAGARHEQAVSQKEASLFQAPAPGPLLQRIRPVAADLRVDSRVHCCGTLCPTSPSPRWDPTRRTFHNVGLLDAIGEGHIYPTVRAAVQAACPKREGA